MLGASTKKREFSFKDFFPIDDITSEQAGLEIISTEEFLRREGITGNLRDKDGTTAFVPGNRTLWDGDTQSANRMLYPWLRNVATIPDWDPEACMAAFPSTTTLDGEDELRKAWEAIVTKEGFPTADPYVQHPTPVYASVKDRMAENNRRRGRLCVYNATMRSKKVLHFHGKQKLGGRLLVHFYAFLFFADWRQDLWMKRFVRDHIRYVDEIQCAAARVVHAVRERARSRNASNTHGDYDAFHIRRGEFQYKRTRVSAQEIYDISKDKIPDGTTVYGALGIAPLVLCTLK